MPWTMQTLDIDGMRYGYSVYSVNRFTPTLPAALVMFARYAFNRTLSYASADYCVRQARLRQAAAESHLERQKAHRAEMQKMMGGTWADDPSEEVVTGDWAIVAVGALRRIAGLDQCEAVGWRSMTLPQRLNACYWRRPALVMIRVLDYKALRYALCIGKTHTGQLLFLDPGLGVVASATACSAVGGKVVYRQLAHSFDRPGLPALSGERVSVGLIHFAAFPP